jgi:hypothetical protein
MTQHPRRQSLHSHSCGRRKSHLIGRNLVTYFISLLPNVFIE